MIVAQFVSESLALMKNGLDYSVHRSPTLVRILSQINPTHNFVLYFIRTHFCIPAVSTFFCYVRWFNIFLTLADIMLLVHLVFSQIFIFVARNVLMYTFVKIEVITEGLKSSENDYDGGWRSAQIGQL
jgi:hypothetical protein